MDMHMIAERTVVMMVLAMHIRRDATAQGDEFRPRRDRQEPALRNDQLQGSRPVSAPASPRSTPFTGSNSSRRLMRSVEQHMSMFVQRRIAVAAPLAARDHAVGSAAKVGVAFRAQQFA